MTTIVPSFVSTFNTPPDHAARSPNINTATDGHTQVGRRTGAMAGVALIEPSPDFLRSIRLSHRVPGAVGSAAVLARTADPTASALSGTVIAEANAIFGGFEGYGQSFIGVRDRERPFKVSVLSGPTRLVVDVATG